MALQGVDIRRWDLATLLAAYEVTLEQGAKDEAAWRRVRGQLYAEPKEVKQERQQAARAAAVEGRKTRTAAHQAMTLDSVEALLAGAAAADAQFGTG